MRPECSSPSTRTVIWLGVQRMNTLVVAQKKETRPPSAFEDVSARRAIAPLIPAPPKFANHDSLSVPSQPR